MSKVTLGFLDKCEPWKLESRLFPSKVGGKPAWLSLKLVPSSDQLTCEKCEKVMVFLCQVYAPFECESQSHNNFHRSIFVFICRNAACHEDRTIESIKIFRSTLCRENEFYSVDPPKEIDDKTLDITKWLSLCNLCGIVSQKKCGKCKMVMYCCREHQIIDWKNGHKLQCSSGLTSALKASSNSDFLFSEWELVNEEEELDKHCVSEEEALLEYIRLKDNGKVGTLDELPESDLECHASAEIDKIFSKFKKRISEYPDQVIRYNRGGEALLISSYPMPLNIPNCEYCGSPRQFEFQIMPQLLYELHEPDLDWGVLLVYTCRGSCVGDSINSYKKEYVFRQDVTDNPIC